MRSDRLLRLLVLFPLLVALLLWVQHHFGVGPENPGWLPVVSGAAAAVLGWLGKAVEEADRAWISGRVRQVAAGATSWPAQGAAALVAIPVLLTVSSVQIVHAPAGPGARAVVRLAPLEDRGAVQQRTLGEGGPIERFVVLTSPFGRAFQLHVEGYGPETIRVFPITGRTVRPDRDLRRAPAVLVRLSPVASMSLQSEGRLVVWLARGEESVEIASARGERSAFLIGRTQPVPSSLVGGWRLELQALAVPEPLVSRTLWEWANPAPLESAVLLEAGMTLKARVLSRAGREVAFADVTLGSEGFQDLRLEDLAADAEGLR